MTLIVGVLTCVTLILANVSKPPQLFFRYDYQFISELEAYFKYVDTAMSWSDALSECERDGARLFYPPSEEEWKIVKAELNSLRNKTLVIYLGMYNVTDMGELVTIDGKPGNEMYNIWNKEVVQDFGGGCAILNVESDISFPDFLSYEKCRNRHNFICVKHLKITLPCGTIDNDYVQLPRLGNCYKVHHSAAPWRLAFRSCLMEDAHLTTNFLHISTELNLQPTVSYYVGIHRVPGNNAYRFLNGTEVGDNFFLMYGDPGETSCVVLNNERFLQGYPCGAEFPFICQKKMADRTDVPRE